MLTATLHALLAAGETPPEWVHLLPAGTVRARDGRGPYTLADAAGLIARSMAAGPLPVDQDHVSEHTQRTGTPAPAMGWIEALEARADGVWGRVAWTAAGTALLADRAYRGISPVILHDKSGRVLQVLRAGLTNVPALTLKPIINSQDTTMDPSKLREALGLSAEADEAAILAAATTAAQAARGAPALQAQVDALAADLVALNTRLAENAHAAARERAAAAVDGAIRAGKPIPASLREHYIARHAADPTSVETELAAMASLHAGGIKIPIVPGGAPALTPEDAQVVQLLGLDPEKFLAERKRLGLTVEAV